MTSAFCNTVSQVQQKADKMVELFWSHFLLGAFCGKSEERLKSLKQKLCPHFQGKSSLNITEWLELEGALKGSLVPLLTVHRGTHSSITAHSNIP